MRAILSKCGYELGDDSVWRKDGTQDIPDARVEEEHFKVLIETMGSEIHRETAQRFSALFGGRS
jgi:hypothetical protein